MHHYSLTLPYITLPYITYLFLFLNCYRTKLCKTQRQSNNSKAHHVQGP